ncbi:hypothetical protein AB1Y20_012467 [Prymnesium parvum]|uniref:Uncharacterized protein n=1 Tax=Prymnesium parvum TaxID=97485 RepID=A0AB34ILE2_PRYPA
MGNLVVLLLVAALCAGAGALRVGAVAPSRVASAAPRAAPRLGLFDALFGKDEAVEAEKEAQLRAQQEILARRRNPAAGRAYAAELAARRAAASKEAREKIGWQRAVGVDPLVEFKRRQAAGEVKKMGYEDEPKGGIPMPMASFGVGGEFGLGGKYDNGERFDLRLPYAEQGWTEELDEEKVESVDFFANLMSGGKLQREADERRKQQKKGSKGK